jgi:hypothetical protein
VDGCVVEDVGVGDCGAEVCACVKAAQSRSAGIKRKRFVGIARQLLHIDSIAQKGYTALRLERPGLCNTISGFGALLRQLLDHLLQQDRIGL